MRKDCQEFINVYPHVREGVIDTPPKLIRVGSGTELANLFLQRPHHNFLPEFCRSLNDERIHALLESDFRCLDISVNTSIQCFVVEGVVLPMQLGRIEVQDLPILPCKPDRVRGARSADNAQIILALGIF